MVNWLGADIFTSSTFSDLGIQVQLQFSNFPSLITFQLVKTRQLWTYQMDNLYQPTVAGYYTSYNSSSVKLDVLTVKVTTTTTGCKIEKKTVLAGLRTFRAT